MSYDESKVEKKKEGLSQMPRKEEKEKEKLEGGREGGRERESKDFNPSAEKRKDQKFLIII